MKQLNYVAWIKIVIIFIFSLFILTSNAKKHIQPDSIEILLSSLVIFLLAFFGIPAFFKPKKYYVPKWGDNPFLFSFDQEEMKVHRKRFFLICLHFSGNLLLFIGLAGLINIMIRFGRLDLISLRNLIIGIGFLVGIYRATKEVK